MQEVKRYKDVTKLFDTKYFQLSIKRHKKFTFPIEYKVSKKNGNRKDDKKKCQTKVAKTY